MRELIPSHVVFAVAALVVYVACSDGMRSIARVKMDAALIWTGALLLWPFAWAAVVRERPAGLLLAAYAWPYVLIGMDIVQLDCEPSEAPLTDARAIIGFAFAIGVLLNNAAAKKRIKARLVPIMSAAILLCVAVVSPSFSLHSHSAAACAVHAVQKAAVAYAIGFIIGVVALAR